MKTRKNDPTGNNYCPEIWGGIECTINRINDTYVDQLALSGHYDRPGDIDLIADLGIKTLRYPILWERHQPAGTASIDWSWADARLAQIRHHGITPVAGLVHHGSGPFYTDMSKSGFSPGLAAYAGEVARRFPWIEYYTPVNEPLTTARFSGLYGFWYPHHTSDQAFCRMLINQMRAVVLSMREIRKVNAAAKLIQTEDLAKTYAVAALQYQADFENDRRWISFDFLCGKVDREHPLWDFFIRSGITESELLFFRDNPCPPYMMGLNYYVTSERFLDDRLDNYPAHMHGGNWLEPYIDTEAIRVDHGQPSGLRVLLTEARERFNLPIAITESHLHCTAEEKMRWFKETFDICCEINNDGADIRAVTAWSLFGAYGWNKLLTSTQPEYESGVFDLRGGKPRPTAMSKVIKCLATTKDYKHPVLTQKGWWHRHDRFLHKNPERKAADPEHGRYTPSILIVGSEDGGLLHAYVQHCDQRSLPFRVVLASKDRRLFKRELREAMTDGQCWAVIDLLTDTVHEEVRQAVLAMAQQKDTKMMSVAPHDTHLDTADGSIILIKHGILFGGAANGVADAKDFTDNGCGAYAYIPDLINTSLDLLIDDESGEWQLCHNRSPVMPALGDAMERYRRECNMQPVDEPVL